MRRPFCAVVLLILAAAASAQEAGESVLRTGVIAEDLYLAGGRVEVDAEVSGDVLVLGGRVRIGRQVSGDVQAAGGSVEVRGDVADDLRRVASSPFGPGCRRPGRRRWSNYSRLGIDNRGRALLAGGEIRLAGTIAGPVKIAGGKVVLAGPIRGDVEVTARELELLPGAELRGRLSHRTPAAARINPGARVEGPVTHQPTPVAPRDGLPFRVAAALMFALSAAFAGSLLVVLVPRFTTVIADALQQRPGQSLLMGFVLIVTVPIAVMLFLMTGIGVLIALLGLAAYVIGLITGYLAGVAALADLALRRWRHASADNRRTRVLAFVAALSVLVPLQLVPVVGGLLAFTVLLGGLGALARSTYDVYRGGVISGPQPG